MPRQTIAPMPVQRQDRGFYQVALRGQLPLDYRQRVVDATTFLTLSGDAQADLARIAPLLAGVQGKPPALADKGSHDR